MSSTTTVRMTVRTDLTFAEPQFQTPGTPISNDAAYVTTAHSPDLMQATKQAIRYMIDHLVGSYGLSREDAYCLCSVAVDLKISEVVDAPNWIVSAFLPLGITGGVAG
jgi:acetamidase/formamidase